MEINKTKIYSITASFVIQFWIIIFFCNYYSFFSVYPWSTFDSNFFELFSDSFLRFRLLMQYFILFLIQFLIPIPDSIFYFSILFFNSVFWFYFLFSFLIHFLIVFLIQFLILLASKFQKMIWFKTKPQYQLSKDNQTNLSLKPCHFL